MQEVGEILGHWEVAEAGHFFAGVGDDGVIDACSTIFHVLLKERVKQSVATILMQVLFVVKVFFWQGGGGAHL